MPLDGCFIHYLVDELRDELINSRINKITCPNPSDLIMQLKVKVNNQYKNKDLFISARLDAPIIYLTNEKFVNPTTPTNFCMVLRKYLEHGLIKDIKQKDNDRLIIINILARTELDDDLNLNLIIELMGRNSNIILTKEDFIIIDAMRKLPPSTTNSRLILPKAFYEFKESDKKKNPFVDSFISLNELQGLSKTLIEALNNKSAKEIRNYLNQKIDPVIYQKGEKQDFYAYPIDSNDHIIERFDTLSSLLYTYYHLTKKNDSSQKIELEKVLKKEIKKLNTKKNNLCLDLDKAKDNLKYNDLGILLQTNLYKVKKGDSFIIVNDFYHDDKEIKLLLNPLLDPKQNLNHYFTLAKKAKKTLIEADKQLNLVNEDLDYFEELLFQIEQCSNEEIEEIRLELTNNGFLKNKNKGKERKIKIKISSFVVDDCIIYYGKNNLQNSEVTHKLSSSNDYWFHVKDIPGSHVLVKVPANDKDYVLSEKVIRFAANIAAKYSKAAKSSSVPVDYTKIRYVKKIPKNKGSHVTYTNQKTIYIDPE